MLYLDNAATSYRKPMAVHRAMFVHTWKNSVNAGHGGHAYSVRGITEILKTSEKLAELFGIENPECIAYTQNATYALNMAIGGLLKNGGHAVVTQMEHNSVLRPVHYYGNYTIVKADRQGWVNPTDVEAAIQPDTALIVCTHISNVCGTVQPVEEIGMVARKHTIPFLVDAAQSAGSHPIDVEKMNIDMLAFSGHKGLLGPLGTGGLYVRENLSLAPILFGGTGSQSKYLFQPSAMPDMLHCGTLNTPAIIALGAGVDYIQKRTVESITKHEYGLAKRFIDNVSNMQNVIVYGKMSSSARNGTVAFNIHDTDSVTIAQRLNDQFRICVRGGWHCAYPAHIAIGSAKTGAVRVSFGAFDDMQDVNRITDAVYQIVCGRV